jgi:transcriptional regulator with XRE-family HTH domain
VTQNAFGARLLHERERRGISLSAIAERTKIAPALLAALERGDVSRWPGGIYRRSFIRAYASAIGLDPDEIAREFFELFPDPALVDPASAPTGQAPEVTGQTSAAAWARVRLTVEKTPDICRAGPVLPATRQRVGAAAADAAVLVTIATAFALALGNFWAPLAIAMAAYYLGGILIFGNTPGVGLFAILSNDKARPAPNEFG